MLSQNVLRENCWYSTDTSHCNAKQFHGARGYTTMRRSGDILAIYPQAVLGCYLKTSWENIAGTSLIHPIVMQALALIQNRWAILPERPCYMTLSSKINSAWYHCHVWKLCTMSCLDVEHQTVGNILPPPHSFRAKTRELLSWTGSPWSPFADVWSFLRLW